MIGRTLGPYLVIDRLGEGGMGEVYRARDTRLDRVVAIKILPESFAADPDRRDRFEREAKTVSSLDHPNICPLYDVGKHDDSYFLVMPCLDGQTLAERLTKGPLPIDQAVRYGLEIASALHAAHRNGIVHRDLKPGNIMLTKAGAKLLDFGLAKVKKGPGALTLSAPKTVDPHARDSTETVTAIGSFVGTLPYMAPEQMEGREVDARTDNFSFGAVLYEMVTGRRAFEGDSPASIIVSVMKSQPVPIMTLQPLAPAALDGIVTTCLAKDPDDRWQSAADIGRALRLVTMETTAAHAAVPANKLGRQPYLLAVAGVLLGSLLTGLAWWSLRPLQVPTEPVRFSVSPAAGTTFWNGRSSVGILQFAVSPDGRHLAFVAGRPGEPPSLWLRSFADLAAREIAGTLHADAPFWSPTSQMVGFFAAGRLKTLNVSSGEVRDVCFASRSPRGGTWNSDDLIVFGGDSAGGLSKVSLRTGTVEEATTVTASATSHRWPWFLPDGRRFIYYARGDRDHRGLYLASIDGGEPRRLIDGLFNGMYANGQLLVLQQGTLVAYPFDERAGAIAGDPVPLAGGIAGSSVQQGAFSVSSSGVLVHASGTHQISRFSWADRSGRETEAAIPPGHVVTFTLSPDDRQAALSRVDPSTNTADIWSVDFDRATNTRFTSDPSNDLAGVWSADGQSILYRSDRSGDNWLYKKRASGGGTDELVTSLIAPNPTAWSRDGSLVLFYQTVAKTNLDVGLVALGASPKITFIINSEFDEYDGRFSPDDRLLAYVSDESGRPEVYVQPFPLTGNKWTISANGGIEPRWRSDGKELFFLALDGGVMSVTVDASDGFRASPARKLFQTRVSGVPNPFQSFLDVTADGQRFLLKTSAPGAASPFFTVVLNWPETLATK